MWDGMRYHTLAWELKQRFGERLGKLSLDGGFTCPNRDGTLGRGGCIFCSAGGSGDFSAPASLSPDEQIEYARAHIAARYQSSRYILYYQAYTGTYADADRLRSIYMPAALRPETAVLSIGTRPDCLPEDVLALLEELRAVKPVWIELGLQTSREETARFIRRGYTDDVFEKAVYELKRRGIEVIVHLIMGLPGETKNDMLNSVRYIAQLPVDGVKLQLLHVLKGTDLYDIWQRDSFHVLTMEEYADIIADALALLPPRVTIHRLTGDGPADLLAAPLWSRDKRRVLNTISRTLKSRDLQQGKYFQTESKYEYGFDDIK
jgi:radical SAM protein (TIGR01212 family)